MSNVLAHVFVSAKVASADATLVDSAKWNDGHVFTGGANGNLLFRDTTDATYGAAWSSGLTYLSSVLKNAVNGLAATSTDGYVLANETAATAGVPVQQSPRLRFRSNVWNTTAVAANNTDDWWIESVPVSGLTPSGLLKIVSSLNGGAARNELTLTGGAGGIGLTIISNITTNSGLIAAAGGFLSFNTRGAIYSPADAQFNFFKADQVTGVGLDWGTANVFKFRTSAQTGYATVDALAYWVSGVAGIDATVTTGLLVGKTMTFSKGVLTAFA